MLFLYSAVVVKWGCYPSGDFRGAGGEREKSPQQKMTSTASASHEATARRQLGFLE